MRDEGARGLVRVRLATGYGLILVSLLGVLGADWDIQWHAVVGRDRTFTPPHDMILAGIALSGVVALAAILVETWWARRRPGLAAGQTDFLGVLRAPLGAYLVGFGAVCSAVAFPLDTYWHALYGIDVSLWAPFHTMIYMGSVVGTFGVIYLLLSARHLASARGDRVASALAGGGVLVALGVLLSKLSTFLTPALSSHALHLGAVTVTAFPLLTAFVAVFTCVLAMRLVRWAGAATAVVVVMLAIFVMVALFVPPMTSLLVQAEHEAYLPRAGRAAAAIVPLLGQTPALLLLPIGLDGVAWMARRGGWRTARADAWTLVVAAGAMAVVGLFALAVLRSGARGGGGGGHGVAVRTLVLSLLLTVPGSIAGWWSARTIAGSLRSRRR